MKPGPEVEPHGRRTRGRNPMAAHCPRFGQCSAPLCPLDPRAGERCWFSDEPICRSRKHGGGIRWIRKQRSILRRQTKAYLGRGVALEELVAASRPRRLSPEARAAARANIKKARLARLGSVARAPVAEAPAALPKTPPPPAGAHGLTHEGEK